MTAPSVAAFYADRHLGNRFGVLGPYYDDRGHKGVDWIHAPRTPIPSWCRGRVVVSTFYRALGQTVIVDRDDGEGFAGFCHLTLSSGLKVGAYVQPGDVVGLVGSTGTSSSGPHLHATLEPTSVIGTRNALDPLPDIRAAVAAAIKLAAVDAEPFPYESESEMRLIRIPDGTVFLVTAFGVKPITSAAHLAILQRVLKTEPGGYINLTAAEGAVVRGYFTPPTTATGAALNVDAVAEAVADKLARRIAD